MSVLKWSWRDESARAEDGRMVPQFQESAAPDAETPSAPAAAQASAPDAPAPDSAIPDLFADRTWAKSWEDEIRAVDRPVPAAEEIWEDDDQAWIEDDTRRSRRGMRLLIAACAVAGIAMGGTALAVWNAIDDDVAVAAVEPEPAAEAPRAEIAAAETPSAPEFSAPAEKGPSQAPASVAEPPREVRVVTAERAGAESGGVADAPETESLTTGSIAAAQTPVAPVQDAPPAASADGGPALGGAETLAGGEASPMPAAPAWPDAAATRPDLAASPPAAEAPAEPEIAAFDARGAEMEPTVGPASRVDGAASPAGFPSASEVEPTTDLGAEAASAAPSSGAPTSGATIASAVNMRAGPDNGAAVVSVLSQGSPVEIISCDLWCEVSVDGKRGYVFNSFVDQGAGGQQADASQ